MELGSSSRAYGCGGAGKAQWLPTLSAYRPHGPDGNLYVVSLSHGAIYEIHDD